MTDLHIIRDCMISIRDTKVARELERQMNPTPAVSAKRPHGSRPVNHCDDSAPWDDLPMTEPYPCAGALADAIASPVGGGTG